VLLLLLLLALLVGVRSLSAGEAVSPDESAVVAAARQRGMIGDALAGARVFGESGCTNCHTYARTGSANLGAPDLTAEGTRGRSARRLAAYIRCPSCFRSDTAMPPFRVLGPANLRNLASFLAASKEPA
jgi:cbb3-type cytochrome c oxidase subunit III